MIFIKERISQDHYLAYNLSKMDYGIKYYLGPKGPHLMI